MTRVRPFDSDGLWLKARLFINRAMDESTEFEEAAFWACCALELLGKAALARINPALIAIPTDDGKSILIASGVVEDLDGFLSVQAKTVWSRCSRAFRQFSESEAKDLSIGRNAYIHSAAMGFDIIGPAEWWPRYWAQANVLITHCDSTVEDFVGPTRARIVEGHLEVNRANLDRRLQALLESARLRLRLHETDSMTGQMRQEWGRFTPETWRYTSDADCPACGHAAMIRGEDIEARDVQYLGGPPDWEGVEVTLTIWTTGLSCDNCHLELDDLDLLEVAGVPDSFQAEGSLDDIADLYEAEYNNE